MTQDEPSWELIVFALALLPLFAFFFAFNRQNARENSHGLGRAWWADAATAAVLGIFWLGALLIGCWRVIRQVL